ncbi:Hypothetical predicted protein [Paramuricea clavata]|uniref:Uncharacterized protein n=1 Tax=Paramuricea clavata TaxID=317549 RepID=A0A6S7FZN4_PARCT|nr:Hypothetical predicted protein [Paramuricea clavata]
MADLSKVLTRQVFADIVVKAFEHLDVAKVANWVVAQEKHHDKEIADGHPQLSGTTATEAATIAKKGKKKQARQGKEKKGTVHDI